MEPFHLDYVLRLGDNALILAQRLGEWCGHGPVLEQDIALSNTALDLLGQARLFLQYACDLENQGRDEDQMAFLRDAHQFRNVLLVEQPNTDWAYTIARQFFFDSFQLLNYDHLRHSADPRIAEVAEKGLKEVTYHQRFSSDWMRRLGDGTDISHRKIQQAVDDLWMFTGELTEPNAADRWAASNGIGPDLTALRPQWTAAVREVLTEATLTVPESSWMQTGGKDGRHTEQLGFLLAEMQFLPRAYPGAKW